MQVRGQGDVDHLDVGPVEQFAIVGGHRGLRMRGLGLGADDSSQSAIATSRVCGPSAMTRA